MLSNLGSTEWEHEGLENTPPEQIVETLAKLGIETDEVAFRRLAHTHGNIDGLVGEWLPRSIATGIWEDYPWLAARALWARWVLDLFSADVFVEQHLDLDFLDEEDPETPEEGQRHWQVAQAVMNVVAPREGPVRPHLLQQLSESSALAIDFWLGNLPLSLARFGMVDEAVEICRRIAPVYEPENFLNDRAEILARAGRREQALRQVEENLAQFPDDFWVRIIAGDVYEELGDAAMAETAYRQALAMTDQLGPSSERSAAVERLVHLLQKAGRGPELAAVLNAVDVRDAEFKRTLDAESGEELGDPEREESTAAEDEETFLAQTRLAPPVASPAPEPRNIPKVGRNDPCPCGSSQKFKRCCGR